MATIVITGASQGIGAEIARKFSSLQDAVVLLLARSEAKLKIIAEECRQLGAEAHYFVCDVTNEAQIKNVATQIITKWSTPDALINNAGFYQPTSFTEKRGQVSPYDTKMHHFIELLSTSLL